MSWSTNTGKTSTTSTVSGSCVPGQPMSATLTLSNLYGAATSTKSFSCPMGPPL